MSFGTKASGDTATAAWANLIEDALGDGNPATLGSYLIFKADSTYYARNGLDGTIDYSGTACHTVVNDAIDALTTGGTIIFTGASIFTLTSTIAVDQQHITLLADPVYAVGAPRPRLVSSSNIDLITITRNYCNVIGLYCDVTNDDPYTEAAIKIHDTTEAIGRANVSHCSLYRSASLGDEGYGVEVLSDGGNGITSITIDHTQVTGGFSQAIRLRAANAGSYVNGTLHHANKFLTFYDGVHISNDGTGTTNNNMFDSLRFQADATTNSCVTVTQGTNNTFTNSKVWDLTGTSNSFVIGASAVHTRVLGCSGLTLGGGFSDSGDHTILPRVIVPFVDGSVAADSGYDIDANGEYARAYAFLPSDLEKIVRITIYAKATATETDAMRLEVAMHGAGDNEAYDTEAISVADKASASSNFADGDVIYWTLTSTDDADIGHLAADDSLEIKVLHEAAGGADCATDAMFRTVEIQYV